MDSDQTAPLGAVWSGFILFAFMIEISLKCILIDAANVDNMGESSKFLKSWTLEIQILKLAGCLQ